MLKNIILLFILIFVAVDAIGVLPIFVLLTEAMEEKEKSRIITQSILTALGLAIGFALVGKLILKWLGLWKTVIQTLAVTPFGRNMVIYSLRCTCAA